MKNEIEILETGRRDFTDVTYYHAIVRYNGRKIYVTEGLGYDECVYTWSSGLAFYILEHDTLDSLTQIYSSMWEEARETCGVDGETCERPLVMRSTRFRERLRAELLSIDDDRFDAHIS